MAAASSNKSGDVFARILARIERDELHRQCRRIVRRDTKCLHKALAQLHDAFHRLRAVDAAASQLRQNHSHCSSGDAAQNERMEAQIREIDALRVRLVASLDALGQPSIVKHGEVHKDHDWKARQRIKQSRHADETRAEPSLKMRKLDPSTLMKQELIASAATDGDSKPTQHHHDAPYTAYTRGFTRSPPVASTGHPLVVLELELDDADPSARAPTCLDDAQRLAHASLETQSYQFPFLVTKVRTYLSARTHLDAPEVRAIAQALDIAASIGATVASQAPNEPALAELLHAIDALNALAGDDATRVTTAHDHVQQQHAYVAQQDDDPAIRVDV